MKFQADMMKTSQSARTAPVWVLRVAVLVLAASHGAAFAWGREGHQLVARIAQQQLTPHARQEVQKLLALEPGSTLESISTWADQTKNAKTARWHFVNFPRGDCNYERERDCPDGNCVVVAIDRQTQALKTAPTPKQRLIALKYLVHLVADVHPPLHAGWGDDRGGNTYQLRAFKRGTNLRAVGQRADTALHGARPGLGGIGDAPAAFAGAITVARGYGGA